MRFRTFLTAVILFLAMTGAAFSQPKRVLILHSFGRDFAPWSEYARSIREELGRQSPELVDIFEASLATARSADEQEGPFADYLRSLFSKRHLDLVITIGAPALDFVQRQRQQVFANVPAIYTGLDERRVPWANLTENDAPIPISVDFAAHIEHILRVLPDTKNIVIIMGDSPLERYWVDTLRPVFQSFENRVAITWYNDLSLEQMLVRAAALPPHSAIFFGLLSVDAAGVAHEEGRAMTRLHEVATAPIFSFSDFLFGKAIVGGPLTILGDVGRRVGGIAIRIMNGESAGSIKAGTIAPATPRYDWKELQRWNISESRLLTGSEVFFRTPSVWEQYRAQIIAGLAVLLLQAVVISGLLLERQRRQVAEAEATSRGREVIRLNRVTTANVLSSSIAHELNQPLGAILSNTEAAQILLKVNPPDLAQIGEILSDIVRDEQRAGDIIFGLRKLLNDKKDIDLGAFDLNDAVRDVVKIVGPEAAARKIILNADYSSGSAPVRSDPIHMQQVIINLVMNGMDAIDDGPSTSRGLKIRTHRNAETVHVTVSDSGLGIPKERLTSIFDAFFTTKPQGTGLGLPIARTILESYGGSIWAESRETGAVFTFSLPLVPANAA
jgi:signal transduction histidine kinase